MSIPWGETKGDNDLGGYHLVWVRDLVQSATALLATGQTSTPLRALIWLAALQATHDVVVEILIGCEFQHELICSLGLTGNQA